MGQLTRQHNEVIARIEIFVDPPENPRQFISSSTPALSPTRVVTPSESFSRVSVIRSHSSVADHHEYEEDTEVFEERERMVNHIEDQIEEIKVKQRNIKRKMRFFPVSGVNSFNCERTMERAMELRTEVSDYENAALALLRTLQENLSPDEIRNINTETEELVDSVSLHCIKLEDRAAAVARETQHNNSNESANSIQEAMRDERVAARRQAADAAMIKARNECSNIKSDLEKVEVELENYSVDDWAMITDVQVEEGMLKLGSLKTEVQQITKTFRDMLNMLATEGVEKNDVDEVIRVEPRVKNLNQLFQDVKDGLEFQDQNRELYSGKSVVTEKVPYPVFESKEGECITTFFKKLEDCFVKNQVRASDKVDRLKKDCLRGSGVNLIPRTMTDYTLAKSALMKAFGSTSKVLKVRKEALTSSGKIPRVTDRNIVEWFIKLETAINDIIELAQANEGDEDVEFALYSNQIVKTIACLFPHHQGKKILAASGRGEIRLKNIKNLVSEWREEAQLWRDSQDEVEVKPSQSSGPRKNVSNYAGRSRLPGSPKRRRSGNGVTSSSVSLNNFLPSFFNPPRTHNDCRICQQLEADGDTRQLYSAHISSWATGCPRFISMSNKMREEIARKASFCLECLHPDYVYKRGDRAHKCRQKRSVKYSCDKCNKHLWICSEHIDDPVNVEKFKKLEEELKDKHNMALAYVCGIALLQTPEIIIDPPAPGSTHSSSSDPNLIDFSSSSDESVEVVESVESSVPRVPMPQPVSSSCNHQRLSTEDAFSKLQTQLKAKKIKSKLIPLSPGVPQFILGYTRGKYRPLLTLYDGGCSSCVFREGVPEHDLAPAVVKNDGPLYVSGVGNTQVRVNSEVMVTLPLIDGSRAVVEGITVNDVTSVLPQVNLTAATEAVKEDAPAHVKELKVYETIGGAVDILLGIHYNHLMPKPVHMLSSGLTIYKLVVQSHDQVYNATIGGSHESFMNMANYFGGINCFITSLKNIMDNYSKYGPPSIEYRIMSQEDEDLARKFSEEVLIDDLEEEKIKDIIENDDGARSVISDMVEESETVVEENKLHCVTCQAEVLVGAALRDDEEGFMLKSLQKACSEGLNIEYRCPRCRSCQDCRNSFETERVSLREEAEDLMIRDSVSLDWERKVIECSLPMRGEEEEFLSNNRHIAVKILETQCKKYHDDENTKNIIMKAFTKLLNNKHMIYWTDLTDEEKEMIEAKKIQHYIVWRVVFKASISTPARPVFDGSARTPVTDQGGGRCINDLLVKGKITTLNLTRMVLRFMVSPHAVQGDLSQFYASLKLKKDFWNLQRVLIKDDLNPDNPALEAVIGTLIWGMKSVSGQSEAAVIKLAEAVEEKNPRLAQTLIQSRFVDDIGDSEVNMDDLKKLVEDADHLFSLVGLSCKGWTFSGEDPPPEVAEENNTVSIGGMKWSSKLDFIEVPIPILHFSKKSRGRLDIGTETYTGHFMEDMDKFVPADLTPKMILSRKASLFDIQGKFSPISGKLSSDLRQAVRETQTWDEVVSEQTRATWVKNFHMLEKMRGIKFERARMPATAVSPKMSLIAAGDTAKNFIKVTGVWVRFKLKDGSYSCKHLISRTLLGNIDSTLPKEEFDVLTMTSNLCWVTRNMLSDKWVEDYIILSDSTISLCWTVSEKNRLSLYHRNRSVQIRRGTELERLYHCSTDFMPADIGTRPEKVSVADIGPQSVWETGLPWMRGEICDAVADGILTPALELTMNKDEEDDYKKGFIFEKDNDVLTRGHLVNSVDTLDKIQSRFNVSGLIINPAKFSFEKVVRIISLVQRFIKSFKCVRGKISQTEHRFSMLPITIVKEETRVLVNKIVKKTLKRDVGDKKPTDDDGSAVKTVHRVLLETTGAKNNRSTFSGEHHVLITEDDISRALIHLFKGGSREVQAFNKESYLKKIGVLKNGIWFNKSRILQGQEMFVAEGLEDLEFLQTYKPFLDGFNLVNPILDRFSLLTYSIAKFIHQKMYPHRGYESTYRYSLDFVYILEGARVFRELNERCVHCKKLRGKFLELMMGPRGDESFQVCPPFYICQVDTFGPVHLYVPGHEMLLRNKKTIEAKVWILVFACPVTRCINLQVVETRSSDGVIDGIIRLSCEVGVPKFILTDQDSGIMKGLTECEVRLRDLQHVLHKEKGIDFKLAPVSGHNFHGLVERAILSVQDCLKRMDIDKLRLHATGYQTLMKIIENHFNNLPLAYSYKQLSNSPSLQLIFPNLLRLGRNNARALEGPIKMPKSSHDLLKKIEKTYEIFYQLWNTTMVPNMMKSTKWYSGKDENITIGTIVYFKKTDSDLTESWTVGKVTDVVMSKDGIVRRCTVEYQNAGESMKRTTDRAARSLIKLFHIDDTDFNTELSKIEAVIEDLKNEESSEDQGNVSALGSKLAMWVKTTKKACKNCCCSAHCNMESHVPNAKCFQMKPVSCEVEFDDLYDDSWMTGDEVVERVSSLNLPVDVDNLTHLIRSTNLDLGTDSHHLMSGHSTVNMP